MFKESINTKKQGDIGLAVAIASLCKKNYTVCIPLTDSQDYDLVVEIDNKLSKVQVKTTGVKSKYGIFKVTLKVCGGNKSRSNVKNLNRSLIDYLFILTSDGDEYLIPSENIGGTSGINLGDKYKKYIL